MIVFESKESNVQVALRNSCREELKSLLTVEMAASPAAPGPALQDRGGKLC